MREFRSYGSVRGARSNARPYRNSHLFLVATSPRAEDRAQSAARACEEMRRIRDQFAVPIFVPGAPASGSAVHVARQGSPGSGSKCHRPVVVIANIELPEPDAVERR